METCQAKIIELHHNYIKHEFEYKQFLTADRQTWPNGEGVVFKSEDLSLNPGDIKIFLEFFTTDHLTLHLVLAHQCHLLHTYHTCI